MKKIKLNKTSIDKLEPEGDRQYRVYFEGYQGFGVKVYPSGKKSYFLDYTVRGDRRRRRMTLCRTNALSIEHVKNLYSEAMAKIAGGGDPLSDIECAEAAPLLNDWIDQYLKIAARHRASDDSADRRYLQDLLEHVGNVPIDHITRKQIMAAHSVVAERGNYTVNRWRTAVCTCFNTALDMELIPKNPAARIKGLPEEPRDRVLSDDEVAALTDAIEDEDPYTRAAFLIMLETGCRHGEILSATWGQFDLTDGWWNMPREMTKSKKNQVIPINKKVLETLVGLGPGEPDEIVIKPLRRRNGSKSRCSLQSKWEGIKARTGLDNDLRIHDIRRTFGLRICLEHGLLVASKLLRHSSIKITERAYAPLGVEVKGQEILRIAVEGGLD